MIVVLNKTDLALLLTPETECLGWRACSMLH